MTLRGDLATLELADIVQNVEMHRKTGTLSVETPGGTRTLWFDAGAAALLASPGRPALVDDLVRAGFVGEKHVSAARKGRWRTRKSLGEVLVKKKAVDAELLRSFAADRLKEDLCDFLALDAGAFTFTEGRAPRDVFDAEERSLELGHTIGPLLFEAARRKDHWPLIRERVPADSAHYHAPEALAFDVAGEHDLARELVAQLDGTRSVGEVVKAFPHRRFEAYETLARLVDAHAIRTLGPGDMAALARKLAAEDVELSWRVVEDGLATHPHHLGLLREKVGLARARGDDKAAAEAHKLIAHVQLEAGDREAGLAELAQAGDLDSDDTAVWERLLELAIEDQRLEDACAHGMRLVELYRVPGLHTKACTVLESLVRLDPERWTVQRELARARVDSGNASSAVAGLESYGKKLLAREEYQPARLVQEEILSLVPTRKQAQRTIEMIDSRVFERRRALRRVVVRRVALGLAAALLGTVIVLDARARLAYARAEQRISRESLIEDRRYAEACALLEAVRAEHRWTPTAQLELRRRLADLRAKSGL